MSDQLSQAYADGYEVDRLRSELIEVRRKLRERADSSALMAKAAHYDAILIMCDARGFSDPMLLIEEYDLLTGGKRSDKRAPTDH